ncbi:MAG: N-acetyltransferase family protein [Planctomycetota bacterium]
MDADLRLARAEDLPAIAAIVNRSIREHHANFSWREEPLSLWESRFRADARRHPWLVAVADDAVVGFAKSSAFREREAYDWLAETTIYLGEGARGRGLGTRLYGELLGILRRQGRLAALGVIALPNPASVALHEHLGFARTGTIERAGWKFGRWWDVGFWRLAFRDEDAEPPALRDVADALA